MSGSAWPAAVVATAALLVVAACASNDNGGALAVPAGSSATTVVVPAGLLRARLPPALGAAGVLRVGTAFDRAPLSFRRDGRPSGIDPELAQAVGRVLGVSVSFIDLPMAELPAAVTGGTVDIAMAGLADSFSVRSPVEFVDYLRGSSALLVRRANPDRLSGAQDLCRAASVGIVAGTPAAESLRVPCGAPHLLATSSFTQAVARLVAGEVQAVVDDAYVASYTAQTSVAPDEIEVVGPPFDPTLYGIAVLRGASQLRDALQAGLSELLADGAYGDILSRWGAARGAVSAVTTNGGR